MPTERENLGRFERAQAHLHRTRFDTAIAFDEDDSAASRRAVSTSAESVMSSRRKEKIGIMGRQPAIHFLARDGGGSDRQVVDRGHTVRGGDHGVAQRLWSAHAGGVPVARAAASAAVSGLRERKSGANRRVRETCKPPVSYFSVTGLAHGWLARWNPWPLPECCRYHARGNVALLALLYSFMYYYE